MIGKRKDGRFYHKGNETISDFGYSDKELAQLKKKENERYLDQKRVNHIEDKIDDLKQKHGHKPMIGVTSATPQNHVTLHNELVKFYHRENDDKDVNEKTKILLDKLPHDDAHSLLQLASDGAFEHKMTLDDFNRRQKDLEKMRDKKDDFGHSFNDEEKERIQAEKLYNKKYDKWGMKR